MEIEVSIIIVNYNSEDILKLCIDSIIKNTENLKYEIIVVDNCSEKDSLDDLMFKYPFVRWILSEKNGGFGYANNLAHEIAKGKYLYLLNPDTELLNNAAAILTEYMNIHSEVGICGGNMFNFDFTPTTSFYDIDFLKLEYQILFNLRKNYQGINLTNYPKKVLSIVGSNLFIRRTLFNELHGFDSDFFMYFEELELCCRARKMGYFVMNIPSAHIMHLHGATGENKNEQLREWLRQEHSYSKWIYVYKTKGILSTKILYIMSSLKVALANFLFKLQRKEKKEKYWGTKKRVNEISYRRFLDKINN